MQCTRATKAHVRCQFANKAASRVVVAARATSSPNEIGHADANAANDEGQTNDKTNETPTTKLSVSRRTLLSSAPLLAASLAVVVAPPPHLGAIQKATAAAATKKLPKLDPVALYGSVEAAEASRAAAVVALKKTIEPLSSGSVLRYSFHDAGTFDGEKQTGGANGSIFKELDRPENGGLKYAAAVLGNARKAEAEVLAGGKRGIKPLTDADFVQVAGAVAVEITGGPKIDVPLGRPDSKSKSGDPAGQLPSNKLNAAELIALFSRNGYSTRDLVALSGAHSIGFSRVNDPKGSMTKEPGKFSNDYFKLLLDGGGAFFSDRTLVADDAGTRAIVVEYARDEKKFFDDFAAAYVRMGLKGLDVA